MTAGCLYCGEQLTYTAGRGWHHAEGGTVVMRCDDCGWKGAPHPSPTTCPQCGARGRYDGRQMGTRGLRDDHVATPVMSEVARR